MQMMLMWLELEEKEKEKASKVSWVVATYSVATAVEKAGAKNDSYSPASLALSWEGCHGET